ncbi:MAG: hypothetical protein ABJ084_03655 [Halioglobus sp.]
MSLEAFKSGLYEQYQGEVTGEVALNRLLQKFQSPRQRYLLGTVLQLETETKARLRQTVAVLGLDIVESEGAQKAGNELADLVGALDWHDSLQTLCEVLSPVVERFQEIASLAPDEYKDLADSMVAHEQLIIRLFEQEMHGAGHNVAQEIGSQLQFPLPNPG